ncbi:galactose operon repressor [Vibrio ishigakensis]|uniref:Galactose operon repressor n=1 Tax=Vibrio ishigakensis TaxID=1481914 RepID=A0A0B8PQR5_9VIBR|nr:galactose operon repressor [Vibrio ishigakensis]
MATIKDVAKLAGVSVATVSRVTNNNPKASENSIKAVRAAMKELGYRPNANARALVSQTTNTLGVLVSDVADPFFGSMVGAVDKVARANGKHILIGNGYHSADEERRAIELLINSRCQALVIHAKGLSDKELIDYASEVKGLVVINRHIPEIASRCISLDNYKGAYMATEHLIAQGHSQIACIASSHQISDSEERVAGFEDAMKANGIELNPHCIEYGEPNNQGGESAMTNLLAKSLPITAVVTYNDYMAAGAMSVIENNGLSTPKNIAIIGFDDGLIARYVKPRLTTIRYPITLMAEKATELALQLATGTASSNHPLRFSPTLVKRESVNTI